MIVEAAKETDMPTLCELFNQARERNGSFPKEHYGVAEFLRVIEGETILVTRIGGEIVGFASVWEPDIFLHHLYVSPHYQHQGIGSALVEHCVSQFGLPMSLKCIESNIGACRFYEKRGWRCSEMAEGPEGRYVLYVRENAA
jgi:ribosomal protein S18 acetylase RimI-like enzyme